ncbi:MAG: 3-phosphoshikimate 1-carboxyvinyltransferase [Buchananella hordeovulneris]|nr:3-phosphoshikimate 1-carboxyvinyltransferase [Buchananella hordeovulneris]
MTHEFWRAPLATAPVDAEVAVPGSKSLTARELLLSALASGPSELAGALLARDTRLMVAALEALGARIEVTEGDYPTIAVTPGPLRAGGEIDCGLAGTVMRFVPALAALADGVTSFDGDPHARKRPLSALLDSLSSLGVELENAAGCLPVTVRGDGTLRGGVVEVDASASSQFVSALLLIGARCTQGLIVVPRGKLTSRPHIDMTVQTLRERGVHIDVLSGPELADVLAASPHHAAGASPAWSAPGGRAATSSTQVAWRVHAGQIAGRRVEIEPDLSNAGVFLAPALTAGGVVRMRNWPLATTQAGDAWRHLLPQLGASVELVADTTSTGTLVVRGSGRIRGIEADLGTVGELAPTLAALLTLADSPSRLRGIAHLRGHETDRLAALVAEIRAVGGQARELPDGIEIAPPPPGQQLHGARLRAYADHRMATFAAIVGSRVEGVELDDVACTSKTLPGFAERWAALIGGQK